MALTNAVYDATEGFPKHEIYGLTNHIRRAAVSIPSNIAEGSAHSSKKEFVHFLRHARGSLAELETQILIAQARRYFQDSDAQDLLRLADETSRILSGLVRSLQE